MSNDDETLRASLQKLQHQVDSQATDFNAIFASAEGRARGRSKRRFAGLAAAAAVAVLAHGLLPNQEDDFIYVDIEELTATTSWSAPSDSLLPKHRFDLYRELPMLFESTDTSTNTEEGASK